MKKIFIAVLFLCLLIPSVSFADAKGSADAKWCSYSTAGGLACTETAPAGSGDIIDVYGVTI